MNLAEPPILIRSACSARSARPSIRVSTQISRPPTADSLSQTAARRAMLALVACEPVMTDRDRSRSRRSRSPLPSSPGSAQPVSASSNRSAPSTTKTLSNAQLSNRSGNGTAIPARSS